jgi:arylsulfatase A-like enzyme
MTTRPNILVLMVDQLGARALSLTATRCQIAEHRHDRRPRNRL